MIASPSGRMLSLSHRRHYTAKDGKYTPKRCYLAQKRHDILTANMNKALLRILCPVLMLASGLAVTLALSPATARDRARRLARPTIPIAASNLDYGQPPFISTDAHPHT